MLSQTAERIYWFARYIERAENIARLILVRHQLILDLPKKIQPDWKLLVEMLGAHKDFEKQKRSATEKNIISFIFSDPENAGSLISTIASARENMRTTREVMPSEMWECVNALYLSIVKRKGKELTRSNRHGVLDDIIKNCQQITGMLASTMNYDDAYQFILIGRHLERADMTTRIIDAGSASLSGAEADIAPYRNVLWISILRSLSAYQMYKLGVRRKVAPHHVLTFLLQSPVFARSAALNLQQIEQCVRKLSNHQQTLNATHTILSHLNEADLSKLRGPDLHQFVDELQAQFGVIHNSVVSTWLHPEEAHLHAISKE